MNTTIRRSSEIAAACALLGVFATTDMANAASCPAPSKDAKVLFRANFEDNNITKTFKGWKKLSARVNYALTTSNQQARKGKSSMRTELRMQDPYTVRNSGLAKHRAEWASKMYPPNDDRWYGFSVFFPKGYNSDPNGRDVFAQTHGPGKTGQPWELSVSGSGAKQQLSAIVYSGRFEAVKTAFKLGSLKTGKWIDFAVHAKYAHQKGGAFQVWIDGKKKIDFRGPVGPSSGKQYFDKFGMYQPGWSKSGKAHNSPNVVYHVEITISRGKEARRLVDMSSS
jgi:hypothetical protein